MWVGITFAIYSVVMGVPLAAAIVFTIGFHEYCHLLMAHKLGMRTNGFNMIPFIGAMAFVPQGYKTLWRNALVSFAGPLGGGALAFITFGLSLLTGSTFLGAVAFWMAALNLFNLLPISFMDGGQLMNTITYSINRKAGLWIMVTTTILGTFFIGCLNPLIAILVGFFGLMLCRREYSNQKNFAEGKSWLCTPDFLNKPFPMSKKEIQKVALIWITSFVTLTAFCIILSHSSYSDVSLLLGR